ncbi:MAG: hypothetical protein D6776_00045 [Planctomycetota bacterium]|nr:MAG: hypothetical protein D6776_00045 [Planctomycetota bacterium]
MSGERKLLKRITAELHARHPAWTIIVDRRDWLCPFCGEIGAEGLRMTDSLELLILQHLVSGCRAFSGLEDEPLPLETLRERAALLGLERRVRRRVQRDPVWQVCDRKGAWICPFCARPTEVRLDWRALGKGGDGAETSRGGPDVRGVVRHLGRCEAYQRGESEPRPLEELLTERERADRERLRKRLERRLREQPVWRFRDMRHRWVCPYCAESTDIPFDRHAPPSRELCDAVWAHLEQCAAHQHSEGRTRSERYLKERVIAINKALVLRKLQGKLRRRALWQMTDLEDRWLCPYCATVTRVRLPDPRRFGVSEAAAREVWRHLSACPQYTAKPRAPIKSATELRAVLARENRQVRMQREVARALVEDERWQVRDAFGSWLCPYCCKVQKSIGLTRRGAPAQKVQLQIVRHLLEQCPRYTEGAPPPHDREALERAAAGPIERAPSGETEAAGGESGARILRLRPEELALIKRRVELSIEMERSLEQARDRQLRLLPPVPEIEGFEIGVVYRPSARVGGDFYDFVRVSDGLLGIAVGDISGHGIEAALLVGLAKKLLEVHGRGKSSPGQALFFTNMDIYPDLDARTFVTVLYGVLDQRGRRFRFARAGHNPPILYNPARPSPLQVVDSTGMAIGMVEGSEFSASLEEVELQLVPGDMLLLYTDGVTEAMDHDGEAFGLERLCAVVAAHGGKEAEYLLYQVEKALRDFREGAQQHDDITMVAVKVVG